MLACTGNASHAHRSFLCQFSCLAAGSLRPGLRLHTPKWHLPFEENSCRKHVNTHFFPLSLIFEALAWFTASQSSSKSVHVCARGRLVSSRSSLPSNPCPHGASSGVTSSLVPSLSTFPAKMLEHRLRCWSITRMRGLPYDRNQLFLYAFLKVSPD